ncbi:MAG: flagellar biosynthetic protein FliR [Pirellulaceae bacterium]
MWIVSLSVYILMKGPETFLVSVLNSYEVLPIGQAISGDTHLQCFATLLDHCIWLSLRTLGPAMAAYFSGVLLLGIIQRMVPYFNSVFSGMSVNSILFWGAMFLTISGGVYVMHDDMSLVTQKLTEHLQGP